MLSCYVEMLMQVAALLLSQVSSFSVGVGGAHARYKAKPLREPAAHAPAFSEAEKATRSTQCVHLTLHDGSTANAARPLQLPAPAADDRSFIVLTETKFSFRCIPVWDRYSPHRTRVEKKTHVIMLSP